MKKEEILNAFKMLGFVMEEVEQYGYRFCYEGYDYLYMPKDDDENYMCIAMPAIMEVEEGIADICCRLMDKLNSTLKYTKVNSIGDDVWLFYERELLGNEDWEKLLPSMILRLEYAKDYMGKIASDDKNNDDDSVEDESDTVDPEEVIDSVES